MKIVIMDLDNCLSDGRHRIKHINWNESDYAKRYYEYHSRCISDSPNIEALNIIQRCDPEDRIVIFTGRPVTFFKHTKEWLEKFNISEYWLYMREEDDKRPSVDVKKDMLGKFKIFLTCTWSIKELEEIEIQAYDDRPEIVEMYLKMDIPAQILKCHDLNAYFNPLESSPAIILEDMGDEK